uniref:Calcitonin-like peptide 2 n=1 Tax=Stichopus japonicus TaxID=307972 RepID=A0A2Z4C036_STIJA|nr:calcitonin-like peptide precursor 2 [Apostichopus japonicus]
MKASLAVPITLCMFCYLLVTVTSVTINRPNAGLELSRQYPELYEKILRQLINEPTQEKRRVGGCGDFSGCASLKAGRDLVRAMLRPSKFGSGGPGKK